MKSSRISTAIMAGPIGLIAFFVLVAAHVGVANHLDPTARLDAFLGVKPHHPVQLAIAAWMVSLGGGAGCGAAVAWIARARGIGARWVWLAFAAGYLAAMILTMPGTTATISLAWPALVRSLAVPGIAGVCALALAVRWRAATGADHP